MTATGKIRVARNAHKKLLRHKSKRANNAGSKPQYLNDNMVGQAKILAPYGLKEFKGVDLWQEINAEPP